MHRPARQRSPRAAGAPRRRGALTLVLLLAACSRVDLDALPPVPAVHTDKFLAGVTRQLDAAFGAVHDKPGDVQANGQLAMMLQTYKQFASAEVMYRRVRALDPEEFDWCYLHAVVLEALGRPQAAIDVLREALVLDPYYVHGKIRLAALLTDQGELAEAAALYDEVLREPQPPSEAFFSHGKYLLRHGRVEQSIAAFEETLRLTPNLGVAYYQLGLAYRAQGDAKQAQENFALAKRHQGYAADSSDRLLNKLLPLNLSEQPFVHRARVLAENGRLDEAQRFIEMALERNPDSVAAHASMIGMAARQRRFELADEHYARAMELDPDNAKVHFNLGMARIAEERFVEAGQAFEASLRLDDTDPNAHVQLAILQHKNRRAAAAERSLRAALDLDPVHQIGNWLLGELLHERGDDQAAAGHLEKAVTRDHALRPLMFALLAEVRAGLGDIDAARVALAAAEDDAAFTAGMRERVGAVRETLDALETGTDAAP